VGLLPHDMRRSGVRNLRRSGNDEKDCMEISGHVTGSVFDRYDIIDEDDQRRAFGATARIQAAADARGTQAGSPQESRMEKRTDGQITAEKHRNRGKAQLICLRTGSSLGSGKSPTDIIYLLAEREGFEPPSPFRVNLISSQAPSAGLGHLSALVCFRLLCLKRLKKAPRIAEQASANIPPTTGSRWFNRTSLQS
jgi:hypothetical protein